MTKRRNLTRAAARRVAIAATGLNGAVPGTRRRVGPATFKREIARLGLLQIDSVNVFERSHYLPLFARLGRYDRSSLDRLLHHDAGRDLGEYTEYLSHEAAVIPVDDWPLWHWKRVSTRRPRAEAWMREHATLMSEVLDEFARNGPMRPSQLEHEANQRLPGGWWNKSDAYWATSMLFARGDLITIGRTRFERTYAVADAVLPAASREPLPRPDAQRELVRRAGRALGVSTLDDLADYYRLKIAETKVAVESLTASGELIPVDVEGWDRPAWLDADASVPRSVRATALLSPFDPLVWHRPRAARLFDFEYRISIYTPAAKRQHGYYVLPVLIDDAIVGRIDLKSDRAAGVLRVQVSTIEPQYSHAAERYAEAVAPLLAEAARWQGLGEVTVSGTGTWSRALTRAVVR